MHKLGAGADTSWLREPLESGSSHEVSSYSLDTDAGDVSASAGGTAWTDYTVELRELRRRLESLATAVRRIEEEREERGDGSQSGRRGPWSQMASGVELTCGSTVRIAKRAGTN